jgi:hypothetical protein
MSDCPSLLPLGACTLTIPLMRLHRRQIISSVLSEIGFPRWPLVLTAGSAQQLIDIVRGATPLPPPALSDLCYHETLPSELRAGAAERVAAADICLLEIGSPVEMEYDGYILNRNRVRVLIYGLADAAGDRKPAAQWLNALTKDNDALREKSAAALIALLEGDDFACALVARTRAHVASEEEIHARLAAIRGFLGGAMGIVLHNFRYMPDGRPVDWPQGFKAQLKSVADRLGLPAWDPAELVTRHGVQTAIVEQSGHYVKEFNATVAVEYRRFVRRLLDGPRLQPDLSLSSACG